MNEIARLIRDENLLISWIQSISNSFVVITDIFLLVLAGFIGLILPICMNVYGIMAQELPFIVQILVNLNNFFRNPFNLIIFLLVVVIINLLFLAGDYRVIRLLYGNPVTRRLANRYYAYLVSRLMVIYMDNGFGFEKSLRLTEEGIKFKPIKMKLDEMVKQTEEEELFSRPVIFSGLFENAGFQWSD